MQEDIICMRQWFIPADNNKNIQIIHIKFENDLTWQKDEIFRDLYKIFSNAKLLIKKINYFNTIF